MKILITGSSGLIGSALIPLLATGGHQVRRLVRSQPKTVGEEFSWDPASGMIDTTAFEGVEAVIHLAGENIASGRWSKEKKKRLRSSRVQSTQSLVEAMSRLSKPPKAFLCASAIGFYGNRGEELLTEQSPKGSGFFPELCVDWENAAQSAGKKGMRVVNLRFGVVLSSKGGALAKMLTPFKLGVGGVLGNGRQYFSWISIDDAIGAIQHAMHNEKLIGPVNLVSPNPVTNREFTKTLGKVLSRPTIFPMPAFAARLVFGQMADEALLASARVQPKRLIESGFNFCYPSLEAALRHILEK